MFDLDYNIVIGKWTKMYLVGKQITQDQAKDIISKTDKFISKVSLFPYNSKYHKRINDTFGFTEIINHWDRANDWQTEHDPITWEYENEIDNSKERVYANLGLIELDKFNSWYFSERVPSSHINWVHLDGNIFYEGPINGCYVTIHDVYMELEKLAKSFPYLEMNVDVEEEIEDDDDSDTFPVHTSATFVVRNGEVFVYKISKYGNTERFEDVKYEIIVTPTITHSIINQNELDKMIEEFGKQFKPIMDIEAKRLDDFVENNVILNNQN